LAGTAIPKDTVTAEGDILYASGSATVARLGIGTASQVLGIAAGVPAWTTPSSGAMTLISSTTVGTATQTVSLSSIPQTYKRIELYVTNLKSSTTTGSNLSVSFNSDAGSVYGAQRISGASTTAAAARTTGQPKQTFGSSLLIAASTIGAPSFLALQLFNYTSSSSKHGLAFAAAGLSTYSMNFVNVVAVMYGGTAGISSIEIESSSAVNLIGVDTRFDLYGVS
jgi:hypothetical protein